MLGMRYCCGQLYLLSPNRKNLVINGQRALIKSANFCHCQNRPATSLPANQWDPLLTQRATKLLDLILLTRNRQDYAFHADVSYYYYVLSEMSKKASDW